MEASLGLLLVSLRVSASQAWKTGEDSVRRFCFARCSPASCLAPRGAFGLRFVLEAGPLPQVGLCLSDTAKQQNSLVFVSRNSGFPHGPWIPQVNHVRHQYFVFGTLEFLTCWATPTQPPEVLLILLPPVRHSAAPLSSSSLCAGQPVSPLRKLRERACCPQNGFVV